MEKFCPGRDKFEYLIPFGSEINKCVLGMSKCCEDCGFYSHIYDKK